jgi:hypothetical protein
MTTDRFLGWGALVLAVGIAANAILGPLVLGVMVHRAAPSTVSQIVGGDAAALVVIAPFSVIAGVLALRGHRAAPLCVMGPAVYAAYTAMQLAIGQEHLQLAGNVERFFLLHLGLFVLGGALAIVAWNAVDADTLPAPTRRMRRGVAALLLAVAAFLALGLHVPGLIDAWRDVPVSAEYLAAPTPFWVVKLMDLGIVVPVAVTVAVGLLRDAVWARTPVYALLSWSTFLGASVAGMGIVMLVQDAHGATVGNAVAFSAFAGLAAVFMGVVYRPLFTPVRAEQDVPSPEDEPLAV